MTDQETQYTKHRLQIQRGDGPDRRGKVEVEIVRDYHDGDFNETVTLPSGEEVRASPDSAVFAEMALESERAVGLLEERLGLTDQDDG